MEWNEKEFRERINRVRREMEGLHPPAYLNLNYYVTRNMCPICYETTDENDMIHPNDIDKRLRIHKRCWEFIRSHWICQGCKNYFPETQEKFRIPDSQDRCKPCFDALLQYIREQRR